MTGERPQSWAEALAAVDEVLAEIAALRRRVAELQADRDTWRGRASYPN
jgi:hypothetical protein